MVQHVATGNDPRRLRSAASRIAGAEALDDLARETLRALVEMAGARRGVLVLGDDPARVVLVAETASDDVVVRRGSTLPGRISAEALAEALASRIATVTHGRSTLRLPLVGGGSSLAGAAFLERDEGWDDSLVGTAELIAAIAAGAFAGAARRDALAGTLRDAEQRARLTERLATLGTVASSITHELRNPIGFVNNFADVSVGLASDLASGLASGSEDGAELAELAEALAQNLARIREHGRRADAIVRGTLQRVRGSSGGLADVAFNTLVREYALSAAEAQPKEVARRVPVEVALDPRVGNVRVVPEEIGRVVLNLVSNAIDAARARRMDEGDEFDPEVRVSTRDLGCAVEVRVRDNGAGIAASDRDKVFEPFYTTKPAGEGTGLGLPLSREIVSRHGGQITFASQPATPDTQTEFVVSLPRA